VLKEKGKEIPLSTATARLPKFYSGTVLFLSIGVTGKRKRCRLYSSDRKTSKGEKKKKSSESLLKHVQKALNYFVV
jgi:hypothetical protein